MLVASVAVHTLQLACCHRIMILYHRDSSKPTNNALTADCYGCTISAWVLTTPGRDYHFAAETADEKAKWVAAMQTQVDHTTIFT
jgi:hypothetical protein